MRELFLNMTYLLLSGPVLGFILALFSICIYCLVITPFREERLGTATVIVLVLLIPLGGWGVLYGIYFLAKTAMQSWQLLPGAVIVYWWCMKGFLSGK